MRALGWNLQRDRDPVVVVDELRDLMETYRVDVALLCETQGYGERAQKVLGRLGYKVGISDRAAGLRETGIVVAPGVRADLSLTPRQLTEKGWFTVRGGETPPKWLVQANVAGRRVAVCHAPPSVAWIKGMPEGPQRRVLAAIQFGRRVERFLRHHPGAFVHADWNDTPQDRGRWTPSGIADRTHSLIVAPERGTHHGGRVIDYALAPKGAGAYVVDVIDTGSDHKAVLYEIPQRGGPR